MAVRILIEELIVLLILVSLIYKQNILSYFLFVVVLIYTIFRFRTRRAFTPCRYTVMAIIIIQYGMAVFNMTSYSSNKWPIQLLVDNVYPNRRDYFFNVPLFFRVA